jgi:hypothetical protein
MLTPAGSPASRSIMVRPTRAAWYEVPQATSMTLRMRPTISSVSRASGTQTEPCSRSTRPRKVSVTARGCSKISLSMKWR